MSSNKQTYKGKKWCEYCKTGINWTKEDIAYHEQSKRHKKNMELEIEFKRQKIIREQEHQKNFANQDESAKMMQEIEKKAEEAMRGYSKQQQQNTSQPKQNAASIGPQMQGISKEPQLTEEQKKELKRQKKREELGSEFGSSYEESDTDEEEEQFDEDEEGAGPNSKKVDFAQKFDRGQKQSEQIKSFWYLSKDEKTGQLFFYNQLSGQKKYEKPIGLKLLEEEQNIWDDYVLKQLEEKEKEEEAEIEQTNKQIAEQYSEENEDDEKKKEGIEKKQDIQINEKEGVIQSGWVEVEEEDNFFNKYAVKNLYGEVADDDTNSDDDDESGDDMDERDIENLAKIELQIESGKIQNRKQMMEALMLSESQTGSKAKQNEKLKKLIERNLDVQSDRQQKVYKKKNWIEEDEQAQNKTVQSAATFNTIQPKEAEKTSVPQQQATKGSLFKKRITNDKNVQKIAIDD